MQAHRTPLFQWRGALTRTNEESDILSALAGQADPVACAAVLPAKTNKKCNPKSKIYTIPKDAPTQTKHLLATHRRLIEQIKFLRNPTLPQSDNGFEQTRERTSYENLIINAWDNTAPLSDAVATLFAEHIHDSVAHFHSWPCSLHDPRGVYCDRDKYYAENESVHAKQMAA